MESEEIAAFVFGIFVGLFLLGAIVMIYFQYHVDLSGSVADDICKKITNDSTAVHGTDNDGNRLVCIIPSYDSTTSIVVKKAGE